VLWYDVGIFSGHYQLEGGSISVLREELNLLGIYINGFLTDLF
jgi:hypothetical protein